MRRALALLGTALLTLGTMGCGDAGGSATTPLITQEALLDALASGAPPHLLDVRSAEEFAAGHVPGAVNIPHTELKERLGELRASPGSEIVVYCESGRRAAAAESVLREAGFENLRHLEGDMGAWRGRELPCVGC